jgi:heat shock protein HslJ
MKSSGFPTLVFTASLATLLTACAPAVTEKEPTPALPQAAAAPTLAASASAANSATLPLRQTVWAWQNTQKSGAWFAPAVPARYTLIFREENRLGVVADCNRGGTVYHVEGNRLTFEPIALTKMLCPADSLDRDFLDGLNAVEGYRLGDKTLKLQLRQGGEMLFMPAQQ